MSDISIQQRIEAMRATAATPVEAPGNPAAARSPIDQLRADFKTVFDAYRARGELTPVEHRQQVEEAGRAIREHSGEKEWMDCATKHFRQMAHQIELDKAFAGRIGDEVRAEREKAA